MVDSDEAQIKAEIDTISKRIKKIIKTVDTLDPGRTEKSPPDEAAIENQTDESNTHNPS